MLGGSEFSSLSLLHATPDPLHFGCNSGYFLVSLLTFVRSASRLLYHDAAQTQQTPTVFYVCQVEKPKKQRRKPAIAEVNDEEDQSAPAAVPDGSGDLAEQVLPEINAGDNGNEPVSDSDQGPEAEPEPEAEAEVTEKKKRSYVRLMVTHCVVFKCSVYKDNHC